MAKSSKRVKTIREKVEPGKLYPAEEAFTLLKELSRVKFAESVDVSVNLGVDPRKSDQVVRGASVLPRYGQDGACGGLYARGERGRGA
jgi:large subunit ribosomal protein L1